MQKSQRKKEIDIQANLKKVRNGMAHKTIYHALIAIVSDCKAIAKAGKNKFQNYNYHKEEDIINNIRPLCVKHGVVIMPEIMEHSFTEVAETKAGQRQWLTSQLIKFTFTHADSETSTYSVVMGQGIDNQDKGSNKATTGATKYALMKALMISDGDDAEGYEDGPNPDDPANDPPRKLPTMKEMLDEIVRGQDWLGENKVDNFDKAVRRNNSLKAHFGTYHFEKIEKMAPQLVFDYVLKIRGKRKEWIKENE